MRTQILSVALLIAATGCMTDRYEARTPVAHITADKAPDFPAGPDLGTALVMTPAGGVTVGQRVSDFCLEIVANAGNALVGTLPSVTYDLRRDGPWVSELGMWTAQDVAARLQSAGYRGDVLAPADMDVRVGRAGLNKADLSTLATVAEQARSLGVDVITFGTLKRENSLSVTGRDVITANLSALDVASGRVIAQTSFEVASDIAGNEAFFALAQRESLWLIDGR